MSIEAMRALLRPVARRIRSIVSRCTIVGVDNTGPFQTVQITVLAGERVPGVPRLEQFGFTGMVPKGSTALAISIGGSRSHTIVIEGEHESRKNDLAEGESAQYNQAGDFVWLKQDGTAYIKARSKVLCEAPEAEFTGNCTVDGNLLVKGTTTLQGNATLQGDAAVQGALSVQGAITGSSSITGTDVADSDSTLAALRSWAAGHYHHNGAGALTSTPVVAPP